MALSTSPLLLDRFPFWLIAAINIGANFLFGALYHFLAIHWPEHGLIPFRSGEIIHWYDYLYFSSSRRRPSVTATTSRSVSRACSPASRPVSALSRSDC
jgi:hypothetical protein